MAWPAGMARQFLADWEVHSLSFVPAVVERIDFDDQVARLDQRMREAGENESDAAELLRRLTEARNERCGPVSQRLLAWLDESVKPQQRETFESQDPFAPVGGSIQQWPTGLSRVDFLTGGGYGLTVFGGSAKLGKSLAAMGAAISAAVAGWTVVYVNAELTRREVHDRFRRYTSGRIDSTPSRVRSNLAVLNARPGFSVDELFSETAHTINMDTGRLLIVLDSINRLARNDGSSERNYFERLRWWAEWPRVATYLSEGLISFLVVTELNRREQIKGGDDLEYGGNMVVRFTPIEKSNDIAIDVALSRETKAGECGTHRRDWPAARFVPVDDASQESF